MKTKAWMCWWITCPLPNVLSCEYLPGAGVGDQRGRTQCYSDLLRKGETAVTKTGMGVPDQESQARQWCGSGQAAKEMSGIREEGQVAGAEGTFWEAEGGRYREGAQD